VTYLPAWPARWLWLALVSTLAAFPAAGQLPDGGQAASLRLQQGAGVAPGQLEVARRALLDQGEHLLAAGDPQAALAAFDRAAMLQHAPDTEAALVRSQMQAGDYRQALAFGAHAAGAHRREWPAGMALYVWLLHSGGQVAVAKRMLDDALDLAPDDAALLEAAAQLASPWPRAAGVLHMAPLQIAPYAVGAAVPDAAQVVGSAMLLSQGKAALLPSALLGDAARPAQRIWLRNGLGQTVEGAALARDDALGLVLLQLADPLPMAAVPWVDAEPFGGSPAYMVEYSPGDGAAAWPMLRQGFFARLTTLPGPRMLGIESPAGERGGPVYDTAGRLAGIAVRGADGVDRLVSAGTLATRFGPLLAAAAPAAITNIEVAGRRADVDEVYEHALRMALQVLLVR
jgi:tetratricopeptide (TPR) repeat protein